MQFGRRFRELRETRGSTQRDLAERLGVSVSYISKVDNERLHFGDYPSEKFIYKLASEFDANEDELLLLSDRAPPSLKKRIRERPEAFQRFVGSSRGGAVAMNIDSRDTPLVLLCPAWKNWGTVTKLKPNSVILHSRQDDVIPVADSEEFVANSGLPPETLVEVGQDTALPIPSH